MRARCSKTSKNIYFTEAAAERTIAKREAERAGEPPLRAYPCRYCSFWHLTSREYRFKSEGIVAEGEEAR